MFQKIDSWVKSHPQAVKAAVTVLSALIGWLTHRYGPDVTPQACRQSAAMVAAGDK